jgi:hypothetical protein
MVEASSPARDDWKNIVVIVLWSLAIGLIVCWVSLTLRLGTRQDALYNLTAVLHAAPIKSGEALRSDLPFYNRLLFPLLHRAFSRTFPALSDGQWYILLRICCYQAGFLAFALVCHFCLRAPRSAIGLATAILALATIAGFNHPWEEPSDALDLMAIAWGVGAILRQRFVLCLALSIVFAANRDSVAFLGVAWFVLLATRQNAVRRALEGFVIFAASYATALALRWMLAPQAISNFNTQSVNVRSLLEALVSFDPLSWLAVLCASFVLFPPFLDFARPRVQRFVALGMLLLLPTISFGLINEIRIFLPVFIVLAFAIAESRPETASP